MRIFLFPLLVLFSLFSEEKKAPPPTVAIDANAKSLLFIEAKMRTNDFVHAFELLKKEKPTAKIALHTAAGILQGVYEISSAPEGTLLLVKLMTSQGSKRVIIPIEQMKEIGYYP